MVQIESTIMVPLKEWNELRDCLAEALKYGCPRDGVRALSWVKHPCKDHNEYWTTASGACMACRACEAESKCKALTQEIKDLETRLKAVDEDRTVWARSNADLYGALLGTVKCLQWLKDNKGAHPSNIDKVVDEGLEYARAYIQEE